MSKTARIASISKSGDLNLGRIYTAEEAVAIFGEDGARSKIWLCPESGAPLYCPAKMSLVAKKAKDGQVYVIDNNGIQERKEIFYHFRTIPSSSQHVYGCTHFIDFVEDLKKKGLPKKLQNTLVDLLLQFQKKSEKEEETALKKDKALAEISDNIISSMYQSGVAAEPKNIESIVKDTISLVPAYGKSIQCGNHLDIESYKSALSAMIVESLAVRLDSTTDPVSYEKINQSVKKQAENIIAIAPLLEKQNSPNENQAQTADLIKEKITVESFKKIKTLKDYHDVVFMRENERDPGNRLIGDTIIDSNNIYDYREGKALAGTALTLCENFMPGNLLPAIQQSLENGYPKDKAIWLSRDPFATSADTTCGDPYYEAIYFIFYADNRNIFNNFIYQEKDIKNRHHSLKLVLADDFHDLGFANIKINGMTRSIRLVTSHISSAFQVENLSKEDEDNLIKNEYELKAHINIYR